jgi:hypothetical protein
MQTEIMPASRFIYIRHEPQDGKRPYITRHLVWDVDRFLASQIRQYGEEAKPDDRQSISLTTESDFRKQVH